MSVTTDTEKDIIVDSYDDGDGKDVLAGTPPTHVEVCEAAAPRAVEPPPDGGLKAWLTIVGAFCASFVQFGMANAFGVFQGHYETHQLSNHTKDQIAWIGSIQLFLVFAGGTFSGRIFDAFGAQHVLIPGTVGFVVSLMLTSLCTKYWHFILCQGLLFGMSSALIFNVVVSVPSHWFARRRALAIAVAMFGSGLGGTLWPIAVRRMIVQIGFPWTMRAAGFISLALLLVAHALIRTRLPRRKPSPFRSFLRPLKEAPFVLFAVGASITCWGMFTPFFYAPLNALRLGADASLASYTVAFINAGSAVGRLLAATGDQVGRFNLMSSASTVSSVLILAFWIPLNNVPALIAFTVMYGFAIGLVVALVPACISQISQPHEIGARVGLTYLGIGLCMLMGPPLNGLLLSHYPGAEGYKWSGLLSGFSMLLGSLLMLGARFKLNPKLFAAV